MSAKYASAAAAVSDAAEHDKDENDNFWKSLGEENSRRGLYSNMHLFRALHDMEESLRCLICYSFISNPVQIEPCHHSFCSECIRITLSSQKKRFTSVKTGAGKLDCPICRAPIDGSMDFCKSIVPNRGLEEVVRHFKSMRLLLRDALSSSGAHSDGEQDAPEEDTDPVQTRGASKKIEATQNKLTRIRPVVYNQYKKKQLQELCRKLGLSTTGSEEELGRRHNAYRSKHNAECDSSYPRSQAELVREFNEEEKAQTRCDLRSSRHKDKLNKLYETGGATTGDAATDEKMKNNFSAMVRQLRERKKQEVAKKQDNFGFAASSQSDDSPDTDANESNADAKEDSADAKAATKRVSSAFVKNEETKECTPQKRTSPIKRNQNQIPVAVGSSRTKDDDDDDDLGLATNKSPSRRQPTRQINSMTAAADSSPLHAASTMASPVSPRSSGNVWNCMFQKLVEFYQAHGHTRVKYLSNDEKFITWVRNQRTILGKAKREGNLSAMFSERIAKLDAIQFDWPKSGPKSAATTTAVDKTSSSPRPLEGNRRAKSLLATGSDPSLGLVDDPSMQSSSKDDGCDEEHSVCTRSKKRPSDAFFAPQQAITEKRPKTRTNGVRMDGPWECSQCTFHNHVHVSEKSSCQMCGSVRSKSARIIPAQIK